MLQARLVVEHPRTAKDAWDLITELAKDNKRSRTIALKAELRSLKLGDMSMDTYFRKIGSITTILTSIGSPVTSEDVVKFALEGLPDMYDNVCGIIHHRDPFPDLKTTRVTLTTEEMRLKSKSLSTHGLFVIFSYGSYGRIRGSCRFGNDCKFVYDSNAKTGDTCGSQISGNNTEDLLVKLLGKLGINNSVQNSNGTGHVTKATNSASVHVATQHVSLIAFQATTSPTTVSPGPPYYAPQPTSYLSVPPDFSYPPTQLFSPAQQFYPAQPVSYSVVSPARQAQPSAHPELARPMVTSGQETALPHAFTAGTLHDPTTGTWK
ncbi:hybrid signal transduction histidine kinase M [Tanacetum coccineum]